MLQWFFIQPKQTKPLRHVLHIHAYFSKRAIKKVPGIHRVGSSMYTCTLHFQLWTCSDVAFRHEWNCIVACLICLHCVVTNIFISCISYWWSEPVTIQVYGQLIWYVNGIYDRHIYPIAVLDMLDIEKAAISVRFHMYLRRIYVLSYRDLRKL